MNKEEFLEKLRKKLSILEESEIEDILNEYEGYIEEKISKGSTEKEAVKSMGNIDELARDLLSAYKIKEPQEKNDTFNNIAESVIKSFECIVDKFANKSFNEIIKFLVELVLIFIIIALCKIPFEIIESMGRNILSSFGSASFVFKGIWKFVLEFAYLIFAILLFIKIFESRYLNDFESQHQEKKKETVVKKENKNNKETKKESVVKQEENKRTNLGIIDMLTTVCMGFIKVIVFCILIGVTFYIVGMSITLVFMLYLIFKGIFYFGIYLILISLFVLGIIAFLFLYNFIFNRKSKVGILLITLLVSFVLLGSGVAICAIEFANTTIIYSDTLEQEKTEEYLFDMKDNLILSEYFNSYHNLIVDDTLENKIKVEYKYSDKYYKISANPKINENGKYAVLNANYYVNEAHYSKEFLNNLLNDLKHKQIHVNDQSVQIKIYVSSEVKEKLLTNASLYYKDYDTEDDDLESVCKYLQEEGYELPEFCYLNYDF